MKKILVCTLCMVFVLLSAAWCSNDSDNPENENDSSPRPAELQEGDETIPGQDPGVSAVQDNLNYKNEEYGFSLTFPDAWDGYSATKRVTEWENIGPTDTIDFGFSGQLAIFTIGMHSKLQWQQIKDVLPFGLDEIGQNEDYVFTVFQDAELINSDNEYYDRFTEAGSIIETFKAE